jgi:hypothetical protein
MLVSSFNLSQSFNYVPYLFCKTQFKSEINCFCIWSQFYFFASFRFNFFASHQLSYFRVEAKRREKPFFRFKRNSSSTYIHPVHTAHITHLDTPVQAYTVFNYLYADTVIHRYIYLALQIHFVLTFFDWFWYIDTYTLADTYRHRQASIFIYE